MTLRHTPILALAMATHIALAQETPAIDKATTLPVVTVSGQSPSRLEQPASTGSYLDLTPMQTPASVDVITRAQLDARGDTALLDAITRATGLSSLAHPGNSGSALAARGFSDSTSVMRLYDGMRQYGGVGVSFPFDTWSVERIEVLRGPASVIHGDGAIGGVINIIPKKPVFGPPGHELQATLGSEGKRGYGVGSGGALGANLAYRLDASGERADGWVQRGESRSRAVSGALAWRASADLSVQLSHAQGRQRPMRYFGTPLVNGVLPDAILANNYNVADSRIAYRDRWTELSAQWTPAEHILVRSKFYHIQSERYWRNAETYAFNPASGLVDRSGNTEIGHDQVQTGNTTSASVSGTLFGLANQASLGVDWNRSAFRHTNNTYAGSSGAVELLNPVPGWYQSAVAYLPRYRNKAQQYALFAEDRLEVDAQWALVAGARFDHARLALRDLVSGAQAFERTYSNTGWRIGAVYQARTDLALYAQTARAADPVAGMLMLSAANSAFDVSTGRQVEAGIKQAFADQRGDWTLSAYAITKNNLLTRDTLNPALRVQVGQRSSQGIESTLSLALAGHVQLDANVALLQARYDDFTEAVGGVAVSRNGKVPTDVPERLANLWLGWQYAPGWTLSGGLRHVGKRFADNANTLVMPAYTHTDLALHWKLAPSTSLKLHGANLFDRHSITTSYYTNTQWFVGQGRRVELTLNQRF